MELIKHIIQSDSQNSLAPIFSFNDAHIRNLIFGIFIHL